MWGKCVRHFIYSDFDRYILHTAGIVCALLLNGSVIVRYFVMNLAMRVNVY